MQQSLTFAVIGCGSRGRTYMRIARELGHSITAFADPRLEARETMRGISGDPATREFETGEELLGEPRLADVALVSTQDAMHFEQARAALLQGYDVLLEKPAATCSEQVEELAQLARDRKRKLLLCFVLRYTPFYRAIKKAVDSGMIDELVCINASEGVGPFHHSHSYLRGHWAKSTESSPMIVAKCSHDTDLLHWLTGSKAVGISSYEENAYFQPDNAPEGATDRCTDGCPHAGSCRYDAHRYLGDQRSWLRMIHANAESMTDEQILDWLRTGDWGRCAWRCGHDSPDHQVVSMQFANGVTATLTMTAFDTGRRIRIHGTQGIIEGATHADGREPWIECRLHEGETTPIPIDDTPSAGYAGHGGGDFGLIEALPGLLAGDEADYTEGHRIAFEAAASAARNATGGRG